MYLILDRKLKHWPETLASKINHTRLPQSLQLNFNLNLYPQNLASKYIHRIFQYRVLLKLIT
jgi:hypothetical protein